MVKKLRMCGTRHPLPSPQSSGPYAPTPLSSIYPCLRVPLWITIDNSFWRGDGDSKNIPEIHRPHPPLPCVTLATLDLRQVAELDRHHAGRAHPGRRSPMSSRAPAHHARLDAAVTDDAKCCALLHWCCDMLHRDEQSITHNSQNAIC